jgi:hypothetical protein
MSTSDTAALREAFVEGCRRLQKAYGEPCLLQPDVTFAGWAAEAYPDPWTTAPSGNQYRFNRGALEYRRGHGTAEDQWTYCTNVNVRDVHLVAALLAQHQQKESGK